MKHLALCGLMMCAVAAAHANERGNTAPGGCYNIPSATAPAAAQTQRSIIPQSSTGLVTHSGGRVFHNTGQVVHRGGNVIHNAGQVTHNTPLLNRPVPNYGAAYMPQPCTPGG
ncbi:MAG: hypothetical protein ACRCV9_16765 [Burkholderiaceae bacterium]